MDDHSAFEISRGIKRKADETADISVKRIKPLEQDVVNKIAAGEIIVAPVHALKEMIENSVDARATWVEIIVKEGGMKLLQISDNGHGIHVDDLPILCQRFTTSKLETFNDLASVATYGFRGEALASISYVAHLRVTTRTADCDLAYQAHFKNGRLVPAKPGGEARPKKVAGRHGTQITIEDLFYENPQRRKAFRSQSEEYAKILDIVGRYSIHCEGIAFSCKKHNDNTLGISVAAGSTTLDRMGAVYGQSLAKEVFPFESKSEALGFSASGYASDANYHAKKLNILLFINHRAVESSAFRTSIQRLYTVFLPKGSHPFVYINLEIAPERVDVNIHPTKREVGFLNEDEIVEEICGSLRNGLSKLDTSRTFLTQSLLTSAVPDTAALTTSKPPPGAARDLARPADNGLVRTDPNLRKITSMFTGVSEGGQKDVTYEVIDKSQMQIRLTSVKELRAAVRAQVHQGLSEIFDTQTWVGIVDPLRRVAAFQAGVKLFLLDYGLVANEFFYQLGLTDFGNFGAIVFQKPLDIRSLVMVAAGIEEVSAPDLDLSSAPDRIVNQLVEHREMLLEYFNFEVTENGRLRTLPLLLKGYVPCFAKLPSFLLRLGPCVTWTHEKECFRTFLCELANFYTPEQLPAKAHQGTEGESVEDREVEERRVHVEHVLEHILFPAFKSRLVATKGLTAGVLEIASLKGLYKVFERC